MAGAIWEVKGAMELGINVQEGAGSESACLSRLKTGALALELDRKDGLLHYELLRGEGPCTGWVRISGGVRRLGHLCEVVGGRCSGGIIAREGPETTSPETYDRLSCGALVQLVEKKGSRRKFQRITGAGPRSGWVSAKSGKQNLLLKWPRALRPASVQPQLGPGSTQQNNSEGPIAESTQPPCGITIHEVAMDVRSEEPDQRLPKTEESLELLDGKISPGLFDVMDDGELCESPEDRAVEERLHWLGWPDDMQGSTEAPKTVAKGSTKTERAARKPERIPWQQLRSAVEEMDKTLEMAGHTAELPDEEQEAKLKSGDGARQRRLVQEEETEIKEAEEATVRRLVWNPNSICVDGGGNYKASGRAFWLMANNAMSQGPARQQVMEEFPSQFWQQVSLQDTDHIVSGENTPEWYKWEMAHKTNCTLGPYVNTGSVQLDRVITAAQLTCSDVLLDIGCGTGSLLANICGKTGCRAQGIDINPGLIEQARRSCNSKGLSQRLQFRCLSAEEMDWAFIKESRFTVIYLYALYIAKNTHLVQLLQQFFHDGGCIVTASFYLPEQKFGTPAVIFPDPDKDIMDLIDHSCSAPVYVYMHTEFASGRFQENVGQRQAHAWAEAKRRQALLDADAERRDRVKNPRRRAEF